jgi:anti-sigma factor RsiW
MTHDAITCKRLILEYLVEYEDGTMPAEARRDLEWHLEHCPPCLVFLKEYRATGRTLRMLKPKEIPKNLAEAVWGFVQARCRKEE